MFRVPAGDCALARFRVADRRAQFPGATRLEPIHSLRLRAQDDTQSKSPARIPPRGGAMSDGTLGWPCCLPWGRSYPLLFNPQFQSIKLVLGHALQSHRCGQIQSGNVFYFAAVSYLATEFLYLWVSAHFQKHLIRIGDGQGFFNQAMLDQNAMIRRYCQRRSMGLRSALALFWVFHCTKLMQFESGSRSFCFLPPFFPSAFCRWPTPFNKTQRSVTAWDKMHGDAATMTGALTIVLASHASIP